MLIDKILVGAAWTGSAARFLNNAGTPLLSAADNASGEALADEYTLTLSAATPTTGTITVQTVSPNNPYKGRVVTGVLRDGATVYDNIIPGISLVFANAAWANGNNATVYVGSYLGTFDAFGPEAGAGQAATRHQVVNDGTGAVANAAAKLLTQSVHVRKVGRVFAYVKAFAPGATEKVAGGGSSRIEPYRITLANVAGAGAAKTGDLQVDGVTLGAGTILNLSTGEAEDGVGLRMIAPSYAYRILTGPLSGVEFALSALGATGDTANILIFPSRYMQIAPDADGVAGTYGTADVPLTQPGQSSGVIQPGGVAYYWSRLLVPSGANAESNPYPTQVALSATETGAANYLG